MDMVLEHRFTPGWGGLEVASYINDPYETAGFCFPQHLSAVVLSKWIK